MEFSNHSTFVDRSGIGSEMTPKAILLITLFFLVKVFAEKHEPHLHPEVKIVEYHGPLNKEMLTLFRGAEIMAFINCNITAVPENLLSLLPNLKHLYIINVTSYNVHSEATEGDSKLEDFIYIRGNWQDPSLEFWNGFKHLKKLIVREHVQPFTELEANALNNTNLKFLEVSYSGIEKIHDLAFNNLGSLETLILPGNKLKDFSKDILAPLKNLKTLNLRENLLESFETSQLPELPNLESLNLSKNPLKRLALDGVEKVAPNLKTVDVSDTSITEEQLENLRKNIKMTIIKNTSN